MSQLTTNLSSEEFACNCKDPLCRSKQVADFELVTKLQKAVDFFSAKYGKCSIEITSGNRCVPHNQAEGGKPNSEHTHHIAADIKIFIGSGKLKTAIPAQEMYGYFDSTYPDCHGLGLYHNRVHFDVRKGKARWHE